MCGRYAQFMSPGDIQLAFNLASLPSRAGQAEQLGGAQPPEDERQPGAPVAPPLRQRVDNRDDTLREWPTPSWNVFPTQNVPIIVEHIAKGDCTARRELYLARWGLVPPWAKSPDKGPQLINARIETAAQKRTFAPSLASRRCIVPANGYFEWRTTARGKSAYYIRDDEALAFAGLYSWWKQPDNRWLLTTTILTRAAAPPLDGIHPRTPVILEPEEYGAWLKPQLQDMEQAVALVKRPNRTLTAVRVSPAVGSPRHNTPENVVPLDERQLHPCAHESSDSPGEQGARSLF
ncbi:MULTISPECIES: SOS response-associated peptidase [unclassified Actinobaculum]|uniref:SOS response-associated peptidase n=1 Tax=unclassified Actinobaculum TaxID=2609299 RepID=UPI0023E84275|nr:MULTISPECIES: SOS response-associated peptidase [unclassified Actinobaculum]